MARNILTENKTLKQNIWASILLVRADLRKISSSIKFLVIYLLNMPSFIFDFVFCSTKLLRAVYMKRETGQKRDGTIDGIISTQSFLHKSCVYMKPERFSSRLSMQDPTQNSLVPLYILHQDKHGIILS